MEVLNWENKKASKRHLSFSDDSYEWDSIRDRIPNDVGWDSMKWDGDILPSADSFPTEWVPYGYADHGAQKSKIRRSEANTSIEKKPLKDTVSTLEDEKERETAAEIVSDISEHPGSLEFENLDKEAFCRILPIPSGIPDDRMGVDDKWHFDQRDCQMQTVLSTKPKDCPDLSFPEWKTAQRRERKFEVTKVERDLKMEDFVMEDGESSWTAFANLIKPIFMAMEPKARYTATKKFAEYLRGGA